MSNIQKENEEIERFIREVSRDLFKENKVDLIIGYGKGSIPFNTTPIFISEENDVDKLIWNNFCYINLSRYLLPSLNDFIRENKDKNLKIGVISKGCTARSIIQLIIENQIKPENVVIIGMECNGILNRKKIEKEFGDLEITDILINGDNIIVKGDKFEKELAFNDYLSELCKACKIRAPPISSKVSDIIVGKSQEVSSIEEDDFSDISEFESKSSEEKWAHISELLKDCTRCYACREACPFCYCNLCFIDQNLPTWFSKTSNLGEIVIFHMIRALHVAGRCVACGACSNACPMGIDLTIITRKLEKIVKERFDFTVGLDLDTLPPMMTFKMDDKEEFMLEED
ncbi:4Fe-4S ferredoxin [Candidatus Bathyarchaeota archaeon]|nr:MAG: 4Fe-4S ferredoxin [Candidatus Bathyarchaeota archaeon]